MSSDSSFKSAITVYDCDYNEMEKGCFYVNTDEIRLRINKNTMSFSSHQENGDCILQIDYKNGDGTAYFRFKNNMEVPPEVEVRNLIEDFTSEDVEYSEDE